MTVPQFTHYGLRQNVTVQLDASGAGESRIDNNNASTLWVVRQLSVITAPQRAGATCTVTLPTGIVDTAYFAGTGDVAGGDPPIYLRSGEFLRLTWANGPANGTGIATYYYDEVIM